jgi:anti-anti-sigma factor
MVLAFAEIDAYNAQRLRVALVECDPAGHTVVDFSAVTLCGAAGIHALLEAQARHEGHGGSLRVSHVRPEIRRMFALTHTTGLLDESTAPDTTARRDRSVFNGSDRRRRGLPGW